VPSLRHGSHPVAGAQPAKKSVRLSGPSTGGPSPKNAGRTLTPRSGKVPAAVPSVRQSRSEGSEKKATEPVAAIIRGRVSRESPAQSVASSSAPPVAASISQRPHCGRGEKRAPAVKKPKKTTRPLTAV
jgi:hypothetical protein